MIQSLPLPDHKPRLLIVEDETDVAEFVAEIAEGMGFATTLVHDGADVAETYMASPPDVVILDLSLPGFDGIELLRFLSEQGCRAKIFIASGSDARTLSSAAAIGRQNRLDVVGILPKPFLLEDIEAALAPLLSCRNSIGAEDIRHAIESDEIQVHYQPKMRLSQAGGPRLEGVEALVRWIRPNGETVYPDTFLPVVQCHGLMNDMTEAVADQALRATEVWHRKGLEITTSINLDGSLLDDLTLPDRLAAKTRQLGVDPAMVNFEVTESAAMADAVATMDILTRLRVKSFSVSIDDFGTGYSSLVQLYRLPFNELKIDKSFVMDIGRNDEAAIIVEMLAALGGKLGLTICAEGIESEVMLNHVRACGCDLAQGYLFSKPVAARDIVAFAERWSAKGGAATRLRVAK